MESPASQTGLENNGASSATPRGSNSSTSVSGLAAAENDSAPSNNSASANLLTATTVLNPVDSTAAPSVAASAISWTEDTAEETRRRNRRNFRVMNWHQILMRTGWIFKTESLIMPAVLDMVGGSAWLRGCLPMLNRLGQSIPPLLAANSIRRAPYKKLRLIVSSTTMGVMFGLLAILWHFRTALPSQWLIAAILLIYAVFFSSLGVNQLILSALIGKLIPVFERGKLMQFSSVLGSVIAVSCAWVLLNWWLTETDGNFVAIFAFAGILFVAAGIAAVGFSESPDEQPRERLTVRLQFQEAWGVWAEDKNFRKLAGACTLFGMMMTLFPHYQALARQELNLGFDSLVPWIVAQNLGVAVFSLPAGWLADRHGNRIVLKILMAGLSSLPLAALGLSQAGAWGGTLFFLVFGLVGLTPVTIRTFNNYTLELVEREKHPKYLSLVSLCMAGPAVLGSLAIGWLIDVTGYALPFGLVAAGQLWGCWICFRLSEPRRGRRT